MTQGKHGVIFDLDGTILYTLEDIRRSLNHSLITHGLQEMDLVTVRRLVGHGLIQLAHDAVEEHAPELDAARRSELGEAIADELREHYRKDPLGVSASYPGIPGLLKELRERGLLLGVLSNKDDVLVQQITDELFPGTFHAVAGRKDHIPRKPDPRGLELIAQQLGLGMSRILYVGDSEVDYRTAANAGVPFAAVGWGYRDAELLQSLSPDYFTPDSGELKSVIFRHFSSTV
ncbi:HAD family hydrolase [Salinispira pacifica]|uniref:phosphoglycolate phosphatase n=1 Tax=Salinispira pacifica TaxID=1307761 RepID=V5WL85_9SPIO|nr:HAD-IA family hydrolase [Salinispira pacifica]AHC16329.1 Phosphoglycolate phosphatase [Salinispira pacifica]